MPGAASEAGEVDDELEGSNPGRSQGDVAEFIHYLKENGKPAMAALLGNAYRWGIEGEEVVFFLDHAHANLIPMLNMPRNSAQLNESLAEFFGKPKMPHFRIGHDPVQEGERKREADALAKVKANAKVKFVLEKFNGTIMQCQILEKESR